MKIISIFNFILSLINLVAATPVSYVKFDDDSTTNQETLRQVTVLMRHGERAPVDTYPNDEYINSTMSPYGWGQLTNKGRLNIYNLGQYLRKRYDTFLGPEYTPDKFWLQSTSADRTKMTAMVLASALWKPDAMQTFKNGIDWQPVALYYWTRAEDKLLIIWNSCPMLTKERMAVESDAAVIKVNEKNKKLYEELEKYSGWPMNNPGDVANLYATLRAEDEMDLQLPKWAKDYYPDVLASIATFSYSMNCFNDKLCRLAGGPFVKKLVQQMQAKSEGNLTPKDRKIFAYAAHDNTLVNVLTALKVWDGKDPDYNCILMVELHEIDGKWGVKMFLRNSPDYHTRPLALPNCETTCPLEKFISIMKPMIPDNYDEECKVSDPNYVIPPSPPA